MCLPPPEIAVASGGTNSRRRIPRVMKSLASTGLFLLIICSAGTAAADIVCGANCANWFGTYQCITSPNPASGCTEFGGGCGSISSPSCGGDPDCGFDGRHCPVYPNP